MEEKIVIDKPVSIEGVQATVINKITLSSKRSRVGMGFFARKQPVAVIIDSLQKRRAFRITGEEVLLEELVTEFPSLTGYL
ncbi:MAG: hypothetical protein JSV32_02925 [Dehalococcoidia bacterium]|nr:MAG: hypothetical protein JSV32_02925 [Dehalococcoidia bacterium]